MPHVGVGLDAEIFRSLFAKGVRVAGQFTGKTHVRVNLSKLVKRMFAQGRRHPRGMPKSDSVFACINQPLQHVVHCQVACGNCKYGLPVAHDQAHQLDQRGGFPCTGWAMNNGNIFGSQGKAHGLILRSI